MSAILCPSGWLVRLDHVDMMPHHIVVLEDEHLGLSGEARLIIALLRQALTDLHSPHYGEEARAFLTDARATGFWLGLIGLDGEYFHTYAQAALQCTRET